MNVLTKLTSLFAAKPKNYEIVPSDSELAIKHRSGVLVTIYEDGSVAISSMKNLDLHAVGNLQVSSDTHIGLTAPRIDLN